MSTKEDIVISGMSGRFPSSRNVEEFKQNLYGGVDMVTNSEDRWPDGLYEFANRMGRVPDFDRFDNKYFGIADQIVESMEPKTRVLLETVYESIIDAGMNPFSLRGTRTGVYIGDSGYPNCDGYLENTLAHFDKASIIPLLANIKANYANRISFEFDLKGPSLVTDTACSSGITAIKLAMNDFSLDQIDYAIVGASTLTLQPYFMQIQQEAGLCSPRGMSAVLDESADGYVKSDAIVCVFLQKSSSAKRVYATILSSRLNVDGRKSAGMFHPSYITQQELMEVCYKESGIDPLKLTLIEAHLTGTQAGDPQETRAIYNAYCSKPGRKQTLPLGFLKSNMGHAEGCAALAALVKVILCFENESIPPNLNLKEIRDDCKEYCPPLLPVTEVMKYEPGMAAINALGIGGVNGHLLIDPNYKLQNEDNLKIVENIPRIVNICGRTEEAVNHVFSFIENNPDQISRDFLALLGDTMKNVSSINSEGFPYRGSIIIKRSNDEKSEHIYEYKKQMSQMKSKTLKPVWFLFPGLGGQWSGMAKALMPIKIFADKVEECHQILSEFGVNLKELLLSEEKGLISTMTAKFCATTAIEIALFEILKALDITPDGIIGHSFGEVACAYADGCLTTREAMAVTYFRGAITEADKQIIKGNMVLCGIGKEEAKKIIPPEVVIGCNNAKNTVVLSGPEKQMTEIIETLKKKHIFTHVLDSSGIPYHSHYLMSSTQPMIKQLKEYIPTPRKRSKKWISISIAQNEPKEVILKYASAEYFVHNLISPVHFHDKFKELPSDAIVIEIGPHGVFRKIVNETLESVSYLTLIKKNSNDTNLDHLLSVITNLYELGLNPSIEKLYPKVDFPVSRSTPSISSLMKWEHSFQYPVAIYPNNYNRSTASDTNVKIDILENEQKFYLGHCVDGSKLLPATGFLMLVWRHVAYALGRKWQSVPVIFESVQLRRAVFLSEKNKCILKVRYDRNTGHFNIMESDNVCVVGKVRSTSSEDTLMAQHIIHEKRNSILENEYSLGADDIYKELQINGYDFNGEFRRLKKFETNDFQNFRGVCEWNGNMVTFLDGLLHSLVMTNPFRKVMLPTMMKSIRIDPKVFFEAIAQNKTVQSDDQGGSFFEVMDTNIKTIEVMAEIKASDQLNGEFKAELPFYFNTKSKLLVCPGIEINDIMGSPISRKSDAIYLGLESYEFLPNDDNNAIEELDRNNIIKYLETCKSMAAQLKKMGIQDLKCDFNYQNISDKLLQDYRQNNNQNLVIFRAFDKLYQFLNNENKTSDLMSDSVQTIITEIKKEIDFEKDWVNTVSKNERLIRALTDIVSQNNVWKSKLIVTEINLSSDLFAKEVEQYMALFKSSLTKVDYQLIANSNQDISQTITGNVNFWNTTEDIQIKASDLIILRDTQQIRELSLQNILNKINDSVIGNGFVIIVTRSGLTEPEIALNSVLKNNKSVNNSDLEKRIEDIIKTTEELGLKIVCKKSDTIGTMALLFKKVEKKIKIPEKTQIIEITEERNNEWFESLKEKLIKSNERDNKRDNIWLIANESNINGILGLMNCLNLEPGGECIRAIFDFDHKITLPIDWNSKPFSDILRNDLVINVIKDGKLGTYRHISLPKDYDKTVSNQYFLNLGPNNDLSSLEWFDSSNIVSNKEFYGLNNEKQTLVPINNYMSGIVFYDIMVALGRVPAFSQLQYTGCTIGCEIAGRRADTGERVMGFCTALGYTTNINANIDLITPIPEHWSMSEAVTLLTTYYTAWYGLIERSHLREGESILIHSGAGGVGQSAINICKHYKCDIFVTVGTEEKKRFLIKEYNIPENRIFSSRDIQFKYRIKELTEGKGVDIVLNSLDGEKLDASYECLADGGRFVEMGKFDLAQNKQLGMFDFLRDICFIGVSVYVCFLQKTEFIQKFFVWMHKNSTNGCIKPLNTTIFNANEVEKAFRHMTTGKHIGKIVIKIRDEEKTKGSMKYIKSAQNMIVTNKTFFDPNKVYILLGGLGGFGMELVHWMITMGARKFVLTSRSGLKTDYQKYVINHLIKFGEDMKYFSVKIEISVNDCITIESTRKVISDASQMGQIGGIFQLSMVLNDSFFESQTYEKFRESVDPKYKVSHNLDVVSREYIGYTLDYFVLISTIACGIGSSGQSNYAYGSALSERICEQRRKDGLHGLAIQYGPITDIFIHKTREQLIGVYSHQLQRISSCCDVLDKLLTVKQSIVTSILRSERLVEKEDAQGSLLLEFWKSMGIDPANTPDNMALEEIGLESIFAIELQQLLQRVVNIKLNLNQTKSLTVGILKKFEQGRHEELLKYVADFQLTKDILQKYRFIIRNESFTPLNKVKKGKPLYFLPPLEITFGRIEELAHKLDRPVIGLNWTKDFNRFTKIEDIIGYYSQLLNKLEPKGSYDIAGCLDGGIVISKLYIEGRINKAVVFDFLSDKEFREGVLSGDYSLNLIFKFLSYLPLVIVEKIRRLMEKQNDLNSKIQILVTQLKEVFGKGLVGTHMEDIFQILVKIIQMSFEYTLQTKKGLSTNEGFVKTVAQNKGKLFFIKGFNSSDVQDISREIEKSRDTYLLPKNEGISVECVDSLTMTNEFVVNKIIEIFN